jgi:hypothetical protein
MKTTISTLIGSSLLATGVALATMMPAQAYSVSTLSCDAAATAFTPDYDNCVGAYTLDGGENDVTDGDDDNIVNKILNVDNVFGTEDWTFLGKDDGAYNGFFNIVGLNNTTGSINFNVAAIEAVYGTSFLNNYDVAVSFKAGKNFSIYEWEAALGTDTIEWSTTGTSVNKNGAAQGLSHGSVYFRKKDGGVTEKTPEPASAAALGLFALASFGALKKKANKN